MTWKIEFDKKAYKELSKFDKPVQQKISLELEKIAQLENPKLYGKGLKGDLANLWRYRVGDDRIICQFEYSQLIIITVRIGHRKAVYNEKA